MKKTLLVGLLLTSSASFADQHKITLAGGTVAPSQKLAISLDQLSKNTHYSIKCAIKSAALTPAELLEFRTSLAGGASMSALSLNGTNFDWDKASLDPAIDNVISTNDFVSYGKGNTLVFANQSNLAAYTINYCEAVKVDAEDAPAAPKVVEETAVQPPVVAENKEAPAPVAENQQTSPVAENKEVTAPSEPTVAENNEASASVENTSVAENNEAPAPAETTPVAENNETPTPAETTPVAENNDAQVPVDAPILEGKEMLVTQAETTPSTDTSATTEDSDSVKSEPVTLSAKEDTNSVNGDHSSVDSAGDGNDSTDIATSDTDTNSDIASSESVTVDNNETPIA